MKILFNSLIALLFFSCTIAQEQNKATQHIALCEEGKGCEFAELVLPANKKDSLLRILGLGENVNDSATWVFVKCKPSIENEKTLVEIHQKFGGTGELRWLKDFDLLKYLQTTCNYACNLNTKRFDFSFTGEEGSGTSFTYINLTTHEAYMPNAAFLQMGQVTDEVVVNQFMRNNKIETFMISEGRKIKQVMAINREVKSDMFSEGIFFNRFQKTGNKRSANGIDEEEYQVVDDEGRTIRIWLRPTPEICAEAGVFERVGFFNIGYFNINGMVYLLSEFSGPNFNIKINRVSDENYSFDETGYTLM